MRTAAGSEDPAYKRKRAGVSRPSSFFRLRDLGRRTSAPYGYAGTGTYPDPPQLLLSDVV